MHRKNSGTLGSPRAAKNVFEQEATHAQAKEQAAFCFFTDEREEYTFDTRSEANVGMSAGALAAFVKVKVKGKSKKGKSKGKSKGKGNAKSAGDVLEVMNLPMYRLPPFPPHPTPAAYGLIRLVSQLRSRRCFQGIVRSLDPRSVMHLRLVCKLCFVEAERAMNRVWRYFLARNFSSKRVSMPSVGKISSDFSFTEALFEVSTQSEVWLMGGEVASTEDEGGRVGFVSSNNVVVIRISINAKKIVFIKGPQLQERRANQAVIYNQGEVLSIGGQADGATTTMERACSFSHDTTLTSACLPYPLREAAMCILGKYTYLIGGYGGVAKDNNSFFSDQVFAMSHDLEEGALQSVWCVLDQKLNTPRGQAAACALEGKMYLCGGFGSGIFLKSVEVYDPADGTWSFVASMTKPRAWLTLSVFNGELYAVGGDGYGQNTTIEKRNKRSLQWELVFELGASRWTCASVLVNHFIFLFGGGFGACKSTFDFVNLRTGKWASKSKGKWKSESKRKLPRSVEMAKALLLSPSQEVKTKRWTSLDVLKLEEPSDWKYDAFEAVSGKVL